MHVHSSVHFIFHPCPVLGCILCVLQVQSDAQGDDGRLPQESESTAKISLVNFCDVRRHVDFQILHFANDDRRLAVVSDDFDSKYELFEMNETVDTVKRFILAFAIVLNKSSEQAARPRPFFAF